MHTDFSGWNDGKQAVFRLTLETFAVLSVDRGVCCSFIYSAVLGGIYQMSVVADTAPNMTGNGPIGPETGRLSTLLCVPRVWYYA